MHWLRIGILVAAIVGGWLLATSFQQPDPPPASFPVLDPTEVGTEPGPPAGETALATFGSGCFWCSDALFRQVKGVRSVVAGYSGGTVPNPTYEQVCTGATGHAEVIQVTYDPAVVTYPELLHVFWRSHDPTTLNQQGNDHGPQYRSVVFAHTDRQRELAELYKRKIDAAGVYRDPVVTEIVPFVAFYPAEAYHQNYFETNPRKPYCRAIIGPKLDKLKQVFADKLKTE